MNQIESKLTEFSSQNNIPISCTEENNSLYCSCIDDISPEQSQQVENFLIENGVSFEVEQTTPWLVKITSEMSSADGGEIDPQVQSLIDQVNEVKEHINRKILATDSRFASPSQEEVSDTMEYLTTLIRLQDELYHQALDGKISESNIKALEEIKQQVQELKQQLIAFNQLDPSLSLRK